jgi:ribosomal protein S18 acetylase RimI-like enzyme
MSKITIEHAIASELDALVTLFEAYRAFYGCTPDANATRQFLSQRIANADSAILLAKEGPRAIGFVQLYPVFSSLQLKRAWILNDLFVHPDYRGHGVARALMAAARQFARETGAASLSLETARDNAPARALYESLGYRLDHTFLHYELSLADAAIDP